MKLDDQAIRTAFTSIHTGPLSAADVAAVVDVARHAASVDGRMDLREMATVARVSKILYTIAQAPDVPVPSNALGEGWLEDIATRLRAVGPRELAYAATRLVVLVDRTVTTEEAQLGRVLAEQLQIAPARTQELDRVIDTLVG